MDDTFAAYFKIRKDSPVPLYFQLKTQLLELLQNHVLQAGDKLPTEAEFCKLLDISRPTVRQAFSELINEGYITRHKAKGTFVAKPKIEGFFFQKLGSFDEEMRSLGLTPSTRVLRSEVMTPPKDVEEVYGSSKEVFHLLRLRYANDEEMVLVHTYIPLTIFPDIQKENFEVESLYEIYKDKYGVEIAYVDRLVEAKKGATHERTLLNMDDEGVILHVTTTAFTSEDIPVEYSIAYYRGDRNRFHMRLERK